MGEPMLSFVRQMRSVSTDPFSGGRNFVSHVAKKEWNVLPVTSTIETQFAVAPGTARAQLRARKS
jgi:2-oxoisovalerate dehydrogenase E1 component alpha subunit